MSAISCEQLSKKYAIGRRERYRALRDVIAETVSRPFRGSSQKKDLIWALKDVSFDVPDGKAVGIIGRNGAGKSTLLKILSRITKPTRGSVRVRGRVGSLLEVGTGFHPELTGRENIFLNGAIIGMRKAEIVRKFDEIVAFAEVEKFLDTPVKRYSSGMYVRLAFAVAAHLETEILVIDEVLAVGDVAFQRKCLGKMGDLSHSGRTVLFVSHNMQAVRSLCSEAIWLEGGQIKATGSSPNVIEKYLDLASRNENSGDPNTVLAAMPPDSTFRMNYVSLEQDGVTAATVLSGKPLDLALGYTLLRDTPGFHICVQVFDVEGTMLLETIHNGDSADLPVVEAGDYVSRVSFPAEFFAAHAFEVAIVPSIASQRDIWPRPLTIPFAVEASGKVNRAYPGYATPAKLAPLMNWRTERSHKKAQKAQVA
ncbi:MAG TPA: ABC transporter ATP-binding protein [Pyrinomonadaceae bacterium]|nr:ABC transporter ATP-binding protein [Pyrinomonadaceae bacterium]